MILPRTTKKITIVVMMSIWLITKILILTNRSIWSRSIWSHSRSKKNRRPMIKVFLKRLMMRKHPVTYQLNSNSLVWVKNPKCLIYPGYWIASHKRIRWIPLGISRLRKIYFHWVRLSRFLDWTYRTEIQMNCIGIIQQTIMNCDNSTKH